MKLVDTEIKRAHDSGAWKAFRDGQPIGSADLQIGPNSVDCTLGSEIIEIFGGNSGILFNAIDPRKENDFLSSRFPITNNGLSVYPNRLYLAAVRESFDCSAPLDVLKNIGVPVGDNCWAGQERYEQTYFAPMIDGRSTLARIGLSVHNTAGFGDWGFDRPFTLELTCTLPIVLYPGMRIAQVSFDALCGTPTQRYSGAYTQQTGPQPAVLGEGRI